MTFDPKTISTESKTALVDVGKKYGSDDTLAQAQLTQNAYALYGPALAIHGYAPSDASSLGEYTTALIAANVDRQGARADKKTSNAAYLDALQNAGNLRVRALSVAKNTRAGLLKIGGPAEKAAANSIQSVLVLTGLSPQDADALATQLDLFIPLLKDSTIANAAKDRGGPQLLADIETTAPSLRAAATADASQRGTPAHTALLDLLDGLIVENCRAARRAARSASRERGEEAIAKAFELSALRRNSKNPKPPPGNAPAGGADTPK